MKYQPVIVNWIDSFGSSGWGKDPKEDYNLNCQTVGFLIRKSKDRVFLALNLAATGTIGDTIQIPLVAVKKIRRLK